MPDHCTVTSAAATTVTAGALRAYPNPTSGQTTIRLRAGEAGAVHAVIYDVAGRRVRELAGSAAAPGTLELQWNGRDDGGRRAAAGTYLVRVRVGQQALSTSVVLLR
jgi:flagellar hook assembly protein FlgD